MTTQLYSSLPQGGLQLWEVRYHAIFYDYDHNEPGSEEVDETRYLLAMTEQEALLAGQKAIESSVMKQFPYDHLPKEREVTASRIQLESLVAASNPNGRELSPVELSLPADTRKYRLGVCLIPLKD